MSRSTNPLDDHSEDQRKRLRRWTCGLALVESVAVLLAVYHGFEPPAVLVFLPLVVALPLAWVSVNLWTADTVHRKAPPPVMPRRRAVLGLAAAMVIAFAAVAWIFTAEVAAAQRPADAPAWAAQVQRLQDERLAKLDLIDHGRPGADEDPEVVRLQRQLDDEQKEYREAKRNELCEQDGTCGTGVRGEGREYHAKVAYRVQVEQRITELTAQLAAAKQLARGRVDQSTTAAQDARTKLTEIDGQLERLRGNPPRTRDRSSAVIEVSKDRPAAVILFWTAALVAFLLVDVLGLRLVAWHVYRNGAPTGLLDARIAQQAAIDARRESGAKPYPRDGGLT
ncbi:DUF4407 domain-containing protein [Nocardia sp. NRRL S-836]|uniref:DUF4407 domain-containing protein n=1 Tax=Nocardia sp. NRRL S-836 TaxID=1519492 RepID=UPI0006AE08D6|nr:DUF4407 domain-containing protein [Nocardia sp. NRRL S-836]KOV87187.1 hypothetical protein ADL03_07420 [Nocardia sp. NRRL S-836]